MHLSSTFRIIVVIFLGTLAYSCSDDESAPTDCNSSNLQATAGNVTDASCSLDNGSFDLTISGGISPFEFSVGSSGFQSIQSGTTTVDGVPSGNLIVTVRDGNSCTSTANVTIADINDVTLGTQIEAAGCQTANGTITIAATGGTEPYSYSLDGGAAQTDNVFSGLAVGDYTALVSDDDGCQTSVTVSVISGVSYNDVIMPIIDTNCAKSNCHDGSDGSIPNWTVLSNVQSNAANIKTRTGNGTMPPAGNDPLVDADIQAIACWVDDGALDN